MNTTLASAILLFVFQGQQPGGGFLVSILPFVVIFGIFYLLIIRPQQKRQRRAQQEREQMLNALKPGDKVVTTGGIYGTIVSIKDDNVQLRIAQSVSIEVMRTAIAGPRGTDIKEVEAIK